MNTNHTPGPWEWDAEPGHGVWVNAEDIGICRLDFDSALTDAQYKANARLIAAAPDLLAALDELLRFAEPLGTITAMDGQEIALPCIVRAREAIAKATGEKQ
jgi:hypothetical protein